jgi:hypothetical protein
MNITVTLNEDDAKELARIANFRKWKAQRVLEKETSGISEREQAPAEIELWARIERAFDKALESR